MLTFTYPRVNGKKVPAQPDVRIDGFFPFRRLDAVCLKHQCTSSMPDDPRRSQAGRLLPSPHPRYAAGAADQSFIQAEDKAGAPSPCCSIRRLRLASCLSTQDICIFPPLPLQFSSRSPLKLISLSSSLDHPNYTLISFPLSDCSLFRSHTAILNKCPVKFDFYLTLRV